MTAQPQASPGYCPRWVLIAVIERGSGPAAGIMTCVACARELARTAPQFMDPEIPHMLLSTRARSS